MHAKLMSPERKRKTAQETAAAMRERHERAREARGASWTRGAGHVELREGVAVERADERRNVARPSRARRIERRVIAAPRTAPAGVSARWSQGWRGDTKG